MPVVAQISLIHQEDGQLEAQLIGSCSRGLYDVYDDQLCTVYLNADTIHFS